MAEKTNNRRQSEDVNPFAKKAIKSDIDFSVNIKRQSGRIKAIHGVNGGPVTRHSEIDMSAYFSDVVFPTVRLHDIPYAYWGAVDVPCIFPLFHADHTDPRNYKFGKTDHYIKSILACGSKIIYRLGVSIENEPRFDADPPPDYNKWADICINIIRHYNEGWADGFRYNIKYWEIWNEAENGDGCMWNGSYESFVDFYITVSTRIKAAFPELMIGGPAMNGCMLRSENHERHMGMFLPHIKKAGVPLDFFSWHAYPEHPEQMPEAARSVRHILDEYGFKDTESHLNEWNMAPYAGDWGTRLDHHCNIGYMRRKCGVENSSLSASVLIQLQDAPIDMANFFNAALVKNGMFHWNGEPAKPYFAFKAFSIMCAETPVRLQINSDESDSGLSILAGISEKGDKIYLLASNFQSTKINYTIELQDLPAGKWEITTQVIDEFRNLDEDINKLSINSDGTLTIAVAPRVVRMIKLKRNCNE